LVEGIDEACLVEDAWVWEKKILNLMNKL
jgi:hypothetical protein